jgi:hypothetical protein
MTYLLAGAWLVVVIAALVASSRRRRAVRTRLASAAQAIDQQTESLLGLEQEVRSLADDLRQGLDRLEGAMGERNPINGLQEQDGLDTSSGQGNRGVALSSGPAAMTNVAALLRRWTRLNAPLHYVYFSGHQNTDFVWRSAEAFHAVAKFRRGFYSGFSSLILDACRGASGKTGAFSLTSNVMFTRSILSELLEAREIEWDDPLIGTKNRSPISIRDEWLHRTSSAA